MMTDTSDNCENFEDAMQQTQTELLAALLQPGEAIYPWNPAHAGAEGYFAELEQEFSLDSWLDEEIASTSHQLFARLNQCWEIVSPAAQAVKQSLYQKFAARVPAVWLEAIAAKAQQVVATNLSLAEQLVECVRQLLPDWENEDLLVFARPLAGAMRSRELDPADAALAAARTVEWQELSEIERARLSMAIARSALDQLKNSQLNADS